MTVPNFLYLAILVVSLVGWENSLVADDDVTVIVPAATKPTVKQKVAASDGTPVVHKSLHKKKHSIASTTPASVPSVASTHSATFAPSAASVPSAPPISPANPSGAADSLAVASRHPVTPPASKSPLSAASAPSIETGLPVARYPGMGTPIKGVSTYIPATVPLPGARSIPTTTSSHPFMARTFSSPLPPPTSHTATTFSPPLRGIAPSDFVFTNFQRRIKNSYSWKTKIVTTEFWIGEGSTPISSTTNLASAWDLDWRSSNSGTDSPNDRNGYASARHAATVNPFYVALPFNDLAFPDKSREWLPRGWYRRPKDGKQVSACKDRWVEIKNAQGDVCYAQWEDVGPLRYDHAEYVFGDERPVGLGDDHAGLDVSPAVADYLNINDRNRFTSWRFVDEEDVKPGAWLKLDEQAVIYTALHQLKNSSPVSDLPIQRATEPIEDPSNIDSNKKKIDASKG